MAKESMGFWKSVINSFNPNSYVKITGQKFGRSFLYLFLLIITISLFLSVRLSSTIVHLTSEFVGKVGEKIPEIRITEGVVSVPIAQPYVYVVENYAFIIDTTGQVSSLDDYDSGMLLTRDKLIYKDKARMKTESYDLSKINSLYLTPETLNNWLRKGSKVLIPILFIILVIYYLVAKNIQLFLFSLAALLANQIKNKKLSYHELLNIGVYALTPPTLLASVMILFNLRFPLFGLIYSLLYILIIVLAVGRIPQQGEVK